MITLRMVLTEGAVVGVFLVGILVSRRFGRRWHATEIITMYVLGLLFEVLTAYMWKYHYIFLTYPIDIDGDISVLFPLGWAGMIMVTTTLAEVLWVSIGTKKWWSRHLVLMVVWLVIGDLAETTFYQIGMIEYVHNERTEVNFVLGQLPGLPPTMVLLFYGLAQPLFSQYFLWMERGLARRAR